MEARENWPESNGSRTDNRGICKEVVGIDLFDEFDEDGTKFTAIYVRSQDGSRWGVTLRVWWD